MTQINPIEITIRVPKISRYLIITMFKLAVFINKYIIRIKEYKVFIRTIKINKTYYLILTGVKFYYK